MNPQGHSGVWEASFVSLPTLPDLESPFYLVDLAARPDALRRLYEQDPNPRCRLIYNGTPHEGAREAGPLLVEPVSADAQTLFREGLQEGWAVAAAGPSLTLDDADAHFRQLAEVDAPEGPVLFRFAAPDVLGSMGESFTHTQCRQLLGPLTALTGTLDGQAWQCHQPAPHEPETDEPFTLTENNLRHVAHVRRQRLADSLARHYELPQMTVSTWFDQCHALGAPHEQALVEGSRALARQGLDGPLTPDQLDRIAGQGRDWSARLAALNEWPQGARETA
ncbi:uncharacterized protein DUF4123 [Tamilnaduibacter salinus]|uniref:Uncharacterized protein DUF4123 n=1 Tax=Tamilnaduibacter salinus TaxID=1484056 RepID=A0A2U1CYM0_9GAMM|nr:DUF4123 domain-containing protein [Tamilnaduibacter salinus]PVY77586.1 uncharacterized protein DUF4123 [Tamilnaduibacter salinus]